MLVWAVGAIAAPIRHSEDIEDVAITDTGDVVVIGYESWAVFGTDGTKKRTGRVPCEYGRVVALAPDGSEVLWDCDERFERRSTADVRLGTVRGDEAFYGPGGLATWDREHLYLGDVRLPGTAEEYHEEVVRFADGYVMRHAPLPGRSPAMLAWFGPDGAERSSIPDEHYAYGIDARGDRLLVWGSDFVWVFGSDGSELARLDVEGLDDAAFVGERLALHFDGRVELRELGRKGISAPQLELQGAWPLAASGPWIAGIAGRTVRLWKKGKPVPVGPGLWGDPDAVVVTPSRVVARTIDLPVSVIDGETFEVFGGGDALGATDTHIVYADATHTILRGPKGIEQRWEHPEDELPLWLGIVDERVAALFWDHAVVWEGTKELWRLERNFDDFLFVRFDGDRLLIQEEYGDVLVIQDGAVVKEIDQHISEPIDFAIAPDGRIVLAGETYHGDIQVELHGAEWVTHDWDVWALSLSPDGTRMAVGTNDGVAVYPTFGQAPSWAKRTGPDPAEAVWSFDGMRLGLVYEDGTIEVVEPPMAELPAPADAHTRLDTLRLERPKKHLEEPVRSLRAPPISDVHLGPAGLTGRLGYDVVTVSMQTGRVTQARGHYASGGFHVAASDAGWAATDGARVAVWDHKTARQQWSQELPDAVRSLAWAGDSLLAATYDGVFLAREAGVEPVDVCAGEVHPGVILCRNETRTWTSMKGELRLDPALPTADVAVAHGSRVYRAEGRSVWFGDEERVTVGSVRAIAVSRDGKRVATLGDELWIWSSKGEPLASAPGSEWGHETLIWLGDGRLLASHGTDLSIWKVP